jgi:hypothetical protein
VAPDRYWGILFAGRFTGLFTQAQADNANFDWFSGFVFLFFAVMAFKEGYVLLNCCYTVYEYSY